jgi:hypothetical protein
VTTGLLPLKLELQPNCDPIEGRLSDEHGQTTAFAGWLELMALVEDALVQATDRESSPADRPTRREA